MSATNLVFSLIPPSMKKEIGSRPQPKDDSRGQTSPAQPAARKSQERVCYTVAETATKIGVSKKSVYRLIYRGLLPTSKACRKLLISAHAVENFVEVTS